MRVVETGEFNDKFIEIRSGLKEDERVLLRPPRVTALRTEQPGEELELASEEQTETKAAPAEGEQQTVTTPSLTLRQAEPTTPSLALDDHAQRWERMSPEQREAMRKRLQNMSQEEREKMMQQFRRQRESRGDREGRPSERRQRPSDERQARPRNRPQSGENP